MIRAVVLAVFVLLAAGAVPSSGAHYVPHASDAFDYTESLSLNDGTGNYSGYTETTAVQGSVRVTAVLPNGTESATYENSNSYQNDQGASYRWSSEGNFTFSAVSFRYVEGTDNQTGYVNPFVWFYMNNSLAVGSSFYLLNSQMSVVATDFSYPLDTAAGSTVATTFAEGNGTYQRDDAYGVFSATYNWKSYFDPSTGYIVGYLYTEQDSNSAGDGFTWTDSLAVTATTYPLSPAPTTSSTSGSTSVPLLALVALVVVVIVVVVVIIAVLAARRRARLPTHSAHGQVRFPSPAAPMSPLGAAPPPIALTPSGQPAVQQIVIKETVKVKCQYCGSLIDSTAERCPFCGATRA